MVLLYSLLLTPGKSKTASACRGGNGNPLQCSCLENPRDRGAWWAAVYGVTQSRTRLKRLAEAAAASASKIAEWYGLQYGTAYLKVCKEDRSGLRRWLSGKESAC